jgi:hypothetical protein
MKRIACALVLVGFAIPALSAPPPALLAELSKWSAPATVSRFQFALADLNSDGNLDAVVHVTDPAFCGNGGCPLLVFKGNEGGYKQVADSGLVRKPIYILKEINFGWHSLGAVVGLEAGASVRPIRFLGTEYRSNPIVRSTIGLSSQTSEQALEFEEVTGRRDR